MNRVTYHTVFRSLGIAVAMAYGCGGGNPPKKQLSDGCVQNSDCAGNLVCSFGHCHQECETTKDCSAGARCVKISDEVKVCQLPAEEKCAYNSDCDAPLVCASDDECRNECKGKRDCISGQVCTTSNVCAELSEVDDENNLVGAGGAPADSGGGGAGPEAGGGAAGTDTDKHGARATAGSTSANSPAGAGGQESTTDGVAGAGQGPAEGGASGMSGMTGDIEGGTASQGALGGGAGGNNGGVSGALPVAGNGNEFGGQAAQSSGGGESSGGETTTGGTSGLGGGGSTIPTGCAAVMGTVYFCDDFEKGMSQWLVSGQDWNTTTAGSRSPTHSATDSPDGDYLRGSTIDMTLAASVDLSGSVNPVLTFWHKLMLVCDPSGTSYGCSTSYNLSDFAYVQASSDGGTTWTELVAMTAQSNTAAWTLLQVSLSDYAEQKVKIRFRLWENNDTYQADGWYVDDVVIQEPN